MRAPLAWVSAAASAVWRAGVAAALCGGLWAPMQAEAAHPVAKPIVQWLVQDLPPMFVYAQSGVPPTRLSDLGQGEVDSLMRILLQRMPQYQHELVEMPLARFEKLVKQGQTYCSFLHLRTPDRLNWLYFTPLHPPLYSRQIHLVLRKEQAHRLESERLPLALEDILQRGDLNGLVARDRSFGPHIDVILRAVGDKAPSMVPGLSRSQLLQMLAAQRMDYTLEYPAMVEAFERRTGRRDFVVLPLQESRSSMISPASCSRTPEGRAVVEAVDAAMRSLAKDPQREQWLEPWTHLLGAQDRKHFYRYLDERAKGGPQIE